MGLLVPSPVSDYVYLNQYFCLAVVLSEDRLIHLCRSSGFRRWPRLSTSACLG